MGKKWHHYEIWLACDRTAFLCNTASARTKESANEIMSELSAKLTDSRCYYRLSLNFQ
jgi:hypothetical protein